MSKKIRSQDQLTLLQEDSLASLSVLPGSEEARAMTATSGRRHSQLLKPSSPSGYCLRMLLESSRWHSMMCYLTWKVRATPGRRLLFQLVPSTHGTDETECGLWLTPYGEEKNPGPQGGHLTSQVKQGLWPSPRAGNPGSRPNQKGGKILAEEVKRSLWPTPQTGSHNEAAHNAMSGDWKQRFAEVAGIPTTGQLNPNWVEWLMGFPTGWTDLSA